MSSPRSVHRHLALASVAGGALIAIGLWVAPSLATSGSPTTAPRATATQFAPVGNGALPTERPRLGAGRAPLSAVERGYAVTVALPAAGNGSLNALGEPGAEVLLVDLPLATSPTTSRLATVDLYDYATDRTLHVTVDLSHGSVKEVRTATALQLPPTVGEVSLALRETLTSNVRPAFLREYQQLVGAPLIAPEQVVVTGGVWRSTQPRGGPEDANAPVGCGKQRCLQLLIALPSGRYLTTDDFVVNLSTHSLLPLESGRLP